MTIRNQSNLPSSKMAWACPTLAMRSRAASSTGMSEVTPGVPGAMVFARNLAKPFSVSRVHPISLWIEPGVLTTEGVLKIVEGRASFRARVRQIICK